MADVLETPEQVGRAAGGITGIIYGAHAGTVVLPVVGTFLGAVFGALIGAGLGAPLGRVAATGTKAVARSASDNSDDRETVVVRADKK